MVLLETCKTDCVLLDIELELAYHVFSLLFQSFDLLFLITGELLFRLQLFAQLCDRCLQPLQVPRSGCLHHFTVVKDRFAFYNHHSD